MDDLTFFLELEELYNEYNTVGQILKLNDDQKYRIKRSKLDYDIFRYDFDLTCRFISFFTGLERDKYTKSYLILIKYVFIFSTFLKNRTNLKLTHKNENLLTKATENLSSTLRINYSSLANDISYNNYDLGRYFIAFALVNIHEISGVSKLTPVNSAAFVYLCNERDLESHEPAVVMFAGQCHDYEQLGRSLDETIGSKAFLKYTKQPRPDYKQAIENRILLNFGIYSFLAFVFLIISTELTLSKCI